MNFKEWNFWAGTGTTVGKLLGMDYCMKAGIGYYGVQLENLRVWALIDLNSLGDIFDWKTRKEIAGLLAENKKDLHSIE